ncbi:MAG: hypothetical protein KJ072_09410 [Verrucomicrobia bacterium]|nr:hypothetical protein [Verrucomicrobiota bacterium]
MDTALAATDSRKKAGFDALAAQDFVWRWRDANPEIVNLWGHMENTMRSRIGNDWGPLGDLVPTTLQDHPTMCREMDADVRSVSLLFHNQRRVRDERPGLLPPKVLVVIRPSGAEQVWRAGKLDEFVVRGAHSVTSLLIINGESEL